MARAGDMPRDFTSTPFRAAVNRNTMRVRAVMATQQKIERGERLRGLRDASPHTNASLSDAVGVGERAVANWMAGSTGMTYEHAAKLADIFGVDVNWLWSGDEQPSAGSIGEVLESIDRRLRDIEARQQALQTAVARGDGFGQSALVHWPVGRW